MDDYFNYFKPKPRHYTIPLLICFAFYAFLRRVDYDPAAWVLFIGAVVIAVLMALWFTVAGIMQGAADRSIELLPELKERVYQNTRIEKKDNRWMEWAGAVCNGTELKRRLWIGAGKPFTKKEYSEKMDHLVKLKVLKYSNGKNSNNGYDVNGAGGWDFIKAMSEGRENLPLPSPTS